jgi:E3 ubiquitin-protein ligase MARCH6
LTEEEQKIEHDMYFRALEDETGPSQNENVSGFPQTSDSRDSEEEDDSDEDEEEEDYEHVVADDEEDDEEDENADDVDALDFNEDADWDDEDDQEEDEGEDELRRVDAGVQPAPGPPVPEAADANEDLEGNVEDDMEGAMEAIGMRGPIYGVVQNVRIHFCSRLLLSNDH